MAARLLQMGRYGRSKEPRSLSLVPKKLAKPDFRNISIELKKSLKNKQTNQKQTKNKQTMKTKLNFARWLVVMLLVIGIGNAFGQTSQADPDFACLGIDQHYWVDLPNGDPNSTYTWTIISGPAGGSSEVSGQGTNHYVINFSIDGDYLLRVVETDNSITPSCAGDPVTITITVYPAMVAGIATADQTICNGATPLALNATAPTGGDGTNTYEWEFSIDGGATWTPIAGANALTYAPGALTQTTLYRLHQTSDCGDVYTNEVTITVNGALVAGVAGLDQTICYNTTPAELNSTPPTGGDGIYTYEWEFSTDAGLTWTPIATATALNYQPGALTTTTWYRLHQTSNCGDIYTNEVIITVYGELLAGTASADQTICYNTIPAVLNGTAPTGGDGTYTYEWEFSSDGGATWNVIASANALTYQPAALTQTTIYRLHQTSGGSCGDVYTNEVTITVSDDMVAGIADADQTICNGATPAALNATPPTGGDANYTYEWEFSIDNGVTWTAIAGANALTFAPGALTQTTWYRLHQTSGCSDVYTNEVIITVNGALVAGTAVADQTICYNVTPAELNATAPTGGDGVYTYEWEFSIDGGITWTPIAGANLLNYQPGALTQTTQFRVHQTSNCGDVFTNAVTITVNPQVITSPIWHD